MRYMLLIYQTEQDMLRTQEEDDKIKAAHWAVMDETNKLGIFRGAEPLQPTSTATTLRIREGKLVTLDGPFAETKEYLAGYYILDCKDLDEVIGWASKLPLKSCGGHGCIEIRPLREIPARPQEPVTSEYATRTNG